MNICICSGTYHPDVGGPPTYLAALAHELNRRGHQIKVITHGRPTTGYPYPITRISRDFPAAARLALFGLATLREARGADLLYVNDYGLPPTAANQWLRKPMVLKIVGDFAWEYAIRHGLVPRDLSIDEFQQRRYSNFVERVRMLQTWYTRRADLVIVPSQYLADLVAGWGILRDRLRVIPNAQAPLDSLCWPVRSEEQLPKVTPGEFVVTSVARLAPWKGVDVLIEAVEQVRRTVPRLRLLVVGDGDERSRLERLAAPLDGAVSFLGEVDRSRVPAILRASSVLALCSAYEGLSHVILEAMEHGLPVVATAVGGNLEVIRDGENGLLVPYGDVDALAGALARLATDRALSLRLGEQAAAEARERSWPKLVEATLAVFEEALMLSRVARR